MDISNNDVTGTPEGGSRRKSGRQVKVPEKFTPDVPSSQTNASAKRKRGGEDLENDASDIEEEEEVDEESAQEEEEPAPRKKPKAIRKPAAKKPKVNGSVLHEKAPTVKLPSRPKSKKVAIADRNAEGLYGTRLLSQSIYLG